MEVSSSILDIKKAEKSKIGQVDFSNLAFGKNYSDHMMYCDYIDGEWQRPQIVPYGPMQFAPSTKVFHYGQAVFEGMKAFKDEEGKVFLFRPEENFNRINKSSKRLAIPEFPKELFFESLEALLKLDREWIKSGHGNSLYIRPFVIATEEGVAASPSDRYRFMIITCPAQAYYNKAVKVLFAQEFSRSADGGVGYAKAAGNYGAQFYPTNLAKEKGYEQVIWTDAKSHKYLEEAGTMNVFFRIGDKLLTAPTNDRILDGVTRKSLIQLAKDNGIEVEVDRVEVDRIVAAAEKGELKEIFGAGTAATIAKVTGFEYDGVYRDLPAVEEPYSDFLKKSLQDIQYNRAEDKHNWKYEVK
ncbi:MAG: branched-chain amino acid aminotransferase [Bacteroidota bacterium]